MAAWQSGTHGEAAGTLACTGPSIASSAVRFAGRAGTSTMTSGSPTSVMAPGSHMTRLAKGQEEEGGKKNKKTKKSPAPPPPQAKSYLRHSIMTWRPRMRGWGGGDKTKKKSSVMVTGTAETLALVPAQTTEERVIIAARFTPKAPLSLNQ